MYEINYASFFEASGNLSHERSNSYQDYYDQPLNQLCERNQDSYNFVTPWNKYSSVHNDKEGKKLESISLEFNIPMTKVIKLFSNVSNDLDKFSNEKYLIKLSYETKIEFTKSLIETAKELAKIINEE